MYGRRCFLWLYSVLCMLTLVYDAIWRKHLLYRRESRLPGDKPSCLIPNPIHAHIHRPYTLLTQRTFHVSKYLTMKVYFRWQAGYECVDIPHSCVKG